MTAKPVTSRQVNKTGLITLNRPEAINALNHEMISLVAEAFDRFSADDGVEAIILEGEGARGFCAGGDVREVRGHAVADDFAAVDGFFADEYRLNGAIATSAKPVIALTAGVVMGGGIGLAGHAQYRIASAEAKFAMPESGIGLFCDVGVDAVLTGVPQHQVMGFLLSGVPVGVADGLALNLTDHVVETGSLEVIRDFLCAEIGNRPIQEVIADAVKRHEALPGDAVFVSKCDALKSAWMAKGAENITAALGQMGKENADAKGFADHLLTRCPTSLEVIYASQMRARILKNVAEILEMHLGLARYMARRGDFSEGVRALLVDKDKAPKWSPATLDAVDHAEIVAAIG